MSSWDGSPKQQAAQIHSQHRFSFKRFILSLPVLSDAALLMPAVVPESDLDFDELPAASSLLDAWNRSLGIPQASYQDPSSVHDKNLG